MTHEELLLEIERTEAKTVLSTPEGRRWVWALLKSCDVWGYSPADPIEQNRHAGRRDLGIAVMTRLQELLPGEYALMATEATKALTDEQLREQLKQR